MAQSVENIFKPSFLHRQKQLIIEPGSITFGHAMPHNATKFLKAAITGMRYGVTGIRGYSFNFGRLYRIDIKNKDGEIIKIRFRSFYGVKRQELDGMYLKILGALRQNFIQDISRTYLKKFMDKEVFELLGITFTQDGLVLDKNWEPLPWLDVSTKNYTTYYAIFSMTEPHKYKAFKYLTDWNTDVLYGVSRAILKGKGLWKE